MNTKHLNLTQYLLNGAATGLVMAVVFGAPAYAQEADEPAATAAAEASETGEEGEAVEQRERERRAGSSARAGVPPSAGTSRRAGRTAWPGSAGP